MTLIDKLYGGLTKFFPPTVAGRLDLMRPAYLAVWGGPLNGQERRREIVRELARSISFDRVIETGTFRGNSTEFFAAVFGVPVSTVEGNARYHTYSSRRLGVYPTVDVRLGDSRSFLRDLGARTGGETVFIYLDAHWGDDLPLREELEIIATAWPKAVVLIDDFAVPGDEGYGFDDYGPGKALVEAYLPAEALHGWSLRYPTAPSNEETGAKRGSCVLLSAALADVKMVSLRSTSRS